MKQSDKWLTSAVAKWLRESGPKAEALTHLSKLKYLTAIKTIRDKTGSHPAGS